MDLVSQTKPAALAAQGGPAGACRHRHRNGGGTASARRDAKRGIGGGSGIPSGCSRHRHRPGRRRGITRNDRRQGHTSRRRGHGRGWRRLVERLDVPRQGALRSGGGSRSSIRRGLSGSSRRPGSFHASRRGARGWGAAQDGRRLGGPVPRSSDEVPRPGAHKRSRSRRGPGTASGNIGFSIRHVVIGADTELGIGSSCGCSEGRPCRRAPR